MLSGARMISRSASGRWIALLACLGLLVIAHDLARADRGVKVVADTSSYVANPKNLFDVVGAEGLKLEPPFPSLFWPLGSPFGANGVFQERGAIGNDARHPSFWVDQWTKLFDRRYSTKGASPFLLMIDRSLDAYSDWLGRTYGAASQWSSLGFAGPLMGPRYTRWQKEVPGYSPFDMMGAGAHLGAPGPLGDIQRDWNIDIMKGGISVDRLSHLNEKVPTERAVRVPVKVTPAGDILEYPIYDRLTPSTALALTRTFLKGQKKLRVDGEEIYLGQHNHLTTSFMVEDAKLRWRVGQGGKAGMSDFEVVLKSGADPELVSFLVAPEDNQRNLGLQVSYQDPKGQWRSRTMRFQDLVNFHKLELPPHSVVKVKVFSLKGSSSARLPEGYAEKFRLLVTSSYPFLKDHVVQGHADPKKVRWTTPRAPRR